MHLALFLSGYTGGGAQRRMLTLASGFASRGHKVDLVAANDQGPLLVPVSANVNLVSLHNHWQRLPALRNRRGLWVPASLFALSRYLQRQHPDVVLSTSNPANLTAICAASCAHPRIPVAISLNLHLSAQKRAARQPCGCVLGLLLRHFYPRADRVIAISRGVASDAMQFAGISAGRITTIYNPVDLEHIQAQARQPLNPPDPDKSPIILGVGKLKRQKDFACLIRAFSLVRRSHRARLVILGEGEERRRLQNLARYVGVSTDLLMPGFVANPSAWMRRAALFVLSSAWEGFSNVLVEALAVGCPVVSTDCPSGPREILDNGRHGTLVPPGNPKVMADAMLATLAESPCRSSLQARAAVFSRDAAVDSYLTVLQDLVDEHHAAAEA